MRVRIDVQGWETGVKGERQKLLTLTVLTVVATVGWLFLAANPGCTFNNDYGVSPAEKQMAIRLRQIARASQGEWNELSEEDRRFLVSDVSYGDEGSARMLLSSISRRLKVNRSAPQKYNQKSQR